MVAQSPESEVHDINARLVGSNGFFPQPIFSFCSKGCSKCWTLPKFCSTLFIKVKRMFRLNKKNDDSFLPIFHLILFHIYCSDNLGSFPALGGGPPKGPVTECRLVRIGWSLCNIPFRQSVKCEMIFNKQIAFCRRLFSYRCTDDVTTW